MKIVETLSVWVLMNMKMETDEVVLTFINTAITVL